MQKHLAEWGYGYNGQALPLTGKADEATQQVVQAFQMRFRQNDISGQVDRESMEILDALLRAEH